MRWDGTLLVLGTAPEPIKGLSVFHAARPRRQPVAVVAALDQAERLEPFQGARQARHACPVGLLANVGGPELLPVLASAPAVPTEVADLDLVVEGVAPAPIAGMPVRRFSIATSTMQRCSGDNPLPITVGPWPRFLWIVYLLHNDRWSTLTWISSPDICPEGQLCAVPAREGLQGPYSPRATASFCAYG
jgi:hypothetical protein